MTEKIDAFALLEQFAKLTKLGAEMQKERDGWWRNAGVLRGIAAEAHLSRIRDSLTGVARALEDTAAAVDGHLAVLHEEQAALKERLRAVTVTEADFDEIRRKQKDEAGVKEQRAGAGAHVPRMAWASTATTS